MGRIGRPVEVRLVAGEAGCGRGVVVIVGVARRARHGCVLAGQGVVGIERVIELGRGHGPITGRMARGAVAGQAELRMVWIIGAQVIGGMAGVALGRRCLE